MRFLIGLCLVAGLLWSGWWALASYGLTTAVTAWLDERRTEGWQADVSAIETSGFPWDINKRLNNLALADPETGVAIRMDQISLSTATHWPGFARVRLPQTPIELAVPGDKSAVTFENGLVALDLHPGTELQLDRLAWTADAWTVANARGDVLDAGGLVLSMEQSEDDSATYAVTVNAPDAAPGQAIRDALRIPADWPLTFDQFAVSADVTFDQPWDRTAIEDARPQPRVIKLKLAEASWAELRLNLAADLTVDDAGIPEGRLNVQARNWPLMLDLAERTGVLPPALKVQAERGLTSLAQLSGNPNTLDVQINFAGGLMAVGIFPIGPAPRLVLR